MCRRNSEKPRQPCALKACPTPWRGQRGSIWSRFRNECCRQDRLHAITRGCPSAHCFLDSYARARVAGRRVSSPPGDGGVVHPVTHGAFHQSWPKIWVHDCTFVGVATRRKNASSSVAHFPVSIHRVSAHYVTDTATRYDIGYGHSRNTLPVLAMRSGPSAVDHHACCAFED